MPLITRAKGAPITPAKAPISADPVELPTPASIVEKLPALPLYLSVSYTHLRAHETDS